ncbi:MAG: hypothetical protein WCJ63_01485 [Actinomycetes bacterium]
MSEELNRIVKRIEDEARRLSAGDLDQDAAADAATEVARLAGEAATLVDGFARAAKQVPAAPGQSRLPMDSGSGR